MLKKIIVSAFSLLAVTITVSGCSSAELEQREKEDIAQFYTNYVAEATSLNTDAINEAYTELSQQNYEGQATDAARDVIFERFAEIDSSFFEQYAVQYASYDEVGATYSSVLLMSLATGSQPVTADFPLDAISSSYDEELDITVYEIDRGKVTAPVPVVAEALVTKVDKEALPPVMIVKIEGNWKIIPDVSSLQEIGIPNEE